MPPAAALNDTPGLSPCRTHWEQSIRARVMSASSPTCPSPSPLRCPMRALPRTCPSPVLPVSPQRRARRKRSAAGALPRWLQRWTATSPVSPQSGADTPGQVSTPAASTEVATAQKDEAAGYKKRAEESAADGVVAQRPPRGGDAPPPGSWSWTLNWDPVLLRPDGSPEVRATGGAGGVAAAAAARTGDSRSASTAGVCGLLPPLRC